MLRSRNAIKHDSICINYLKNRHFQFCRKEAKVSYYFITSSTDNPVTDKGVVETVEEALRGGARIVQYREKLLSFREMFPIALQIRELTRQYGALFIVDDHVDLTLAVNADGVHLGQDDTPYYIARAKLGPDKIIGISASNIRQAEEAIMAGANYISLSPIFKTSTKIDGNRIPCGLETLEVMRQRVDHGAIPRVPIVVIGGVDRSNYQDVVRVGADWVCSIHPMVGQRNISAGVQSFIERIQRAAQKRIIYD